jgi:PAS domain S-box-containing protein
MLEKMVQQRTQSLLETEKRFGYVVNHAPISILIISHEGEIVEANPEAVIASGYTRDEMLGKNFISLLVAPESRLKAVEMAAMTLKGHEYRGLELMLQRKDGQKFEYDCSVGMAANEQMGQGQIVAIAQDVTQKKALATNLIKAREAAESADRIKSMFVASMSHELRTPLNSIIGFLGVVLQGMSGELNLKQKDQLGRAYGSARHLLSLISDVIDISKIEAGYLQTHVEKFNLKPLLIEVEQAVLHLAEEKRIEVTIACSAKLSLETDRKRLYQVVLNVVSNAVKYTEKGSVSVVAELKNDQVRIAVKDTGIGIDAEDLDHLFRPFERVESRLKIKTLGTGLGLYLTRKILNQLLDGKITVVSKPEIGSTFTVTIPSIIKPILAQPAKSILEDTSV